MSIFQCGFQFSNVIPIFTNPLKRIKHETVMVERGRRQITKCVYNYKKFLLCTTHVRTRKGCNGKYSIYFECMELHGRFVQEKLHQSFIAIFFHKTRLSVSIEEQDVKRYVWGRGYET